MREFQDKIYPFLVTVGLSRRSRKQRINVGESLVENRNEIVFKRDFEFKVLIVLTAVGFKEQAGFGLIRKRRQIIPTVESKGSEFKRIFLIGFTFADS